MLNASRVLAEVAREASRPSVPLLLAAYALLAGGVALGAEEEHGLYWGIVHLLAPLLMAPFAARIVVRDRERGLAPLLAATPLTRGEALAAKMAFLSLFLLVGVLVTLPVTAALLAPAGPDALRLNLHHVGWALLLGACAAAGGLLVGALATTRATLGLSAAFVLVLVWIGLAAATPELYDAAGSEDANGLPLLALHLSPLTWALDDVQPTLHPVRPTEGSPHPAAGAALLGLVLLGLFALAWLRLQHVDDWVRPLTGRPLALGAAGGLVAAFVLGVGAWEFEAAGERAGMGTWRSVDGGAFVAVSGLGPLDGSLREPLKDGDVVRLTLHVRADEGREIHVGNLSIESPHLELTPLQTGPWTVRIATHPLVAGTGELHADYRVQVRYVGEPAPLTIRLDVDGEPAVLHAETPTHPPPVPRNPVAAAAFAPAAALALAGTLVPRRLRAW